jgi:hypothetical protein
MRSSLLSALTLVLLAAPVGATLTDDEPGNDSRLTGPIQISAAPLAVDAGTLLLTPGDADYVGIGGLIAGDIVTVSTTPLNDIDFEVPDTIIGLFDDTGAMECLNDDAFNNDLDVFPMGYGSLCRFEIAAAGDYRVGVTGFSGVPFDGTHSETGAYVLSVTVVPEPGLVIQLGAGLAGLGLLDRRRRRKIPA